MEGGSQSPSVTPNLSGWTFYISAVRPEQVAIIKSAVVIMYFPSEIKLFKNK